MVTKIMVALYILATVSFAAFRINELLKRRTKHKSFGKLEYQQWNNVSIYQRGVINNFIQMSLNLLLFYIHENYLFLLGVICWLIGIAYSLIIYIGAPRVYERGIYVDDVLLPWDKIQNLDWKPYEGQMFSKLTIQFVDKVNLPYRNNIVEIKIKNDKKTSIESLLKSHNLLIT